MAFQTAGHLSFCSLGLFISSSYQKQLLHRSAKTGSQVLLNCRVLRLLLSAFPAGWGGVGGRTAEGACGWREVPVPVPWGGGEGAPHWLYFQAVLLPSRCQHRQRAHRPHDGGGGAETGASVLLFSVPRAGGGGGALMMGPSWWWPLTQAGLFHFRLCPAPPASSGGASAGGGAPYSPPPVSHKPLLGSLPSPPPLRLARRPPQRCSPLHAAVQRRQLVFLAAPGPGPGPGPDAAARDVVLPCQAKRPRPSVGTEGGAEPTERGPSAHKSLRRQSPAADQTAEGPAA